MLHLKFNGFHPFEYRFSAEQKHESAVHGVESKQADLRTVLSSPPANNNDRQTGVKSMLVTTMPNSTSPKTVLQLLPISLVGLRFCLAPILLWDAIDGQTTIWFIAAFAIAVLSDIFDGIIARRLRVSTATLRQADSWADVCLYLCVCASAAFVHPEAIAAARFPLLAVVVAQLIWWGINLGKYGRPASYHTYSAKLWGITLFLATLALFGCNYAGITLWLAAIVGLIHTLEEICMTLLLPVWTHDVLSLFHALRLRQHYLSQP